MFLNQEPQVTYRHKDGDTLHRFVQYAKDPLPSWAADIRPYEDPADTVIELRVRIDLPAGGDQANVERLKKTLVSSIEEFVSAMVPAEDISVTAESRDA